jgi:hypothetical protein
MTLGIVSTLFAVLSFIITFAAARALSKWVRKRGEEKRAQEAARNQTRQVRRAKERKASR